MSTAEELLKPMQRDGYTSTEYGIFLDQRADGFGVQHLADVRSSRSDAEQVLDYHATRNAPKPVVLLVRTVTYGDWQTPDQV